MKKIITNPGYNNNIIMNLAQNKFLEYKSMDKIGTTILDEVNTDEILNTSTTLLNDKYFVDELKDLAEIKYK